MSETLSVRLSPGTKKKLDALARRSHRSRSRLAADAITAFVEAEEWQRSEIRAALAEVEKGESVSHDRVSRWLRSW